MNKAVTMAEEQPILEVYTIGPTTVVGFGGREVFDEVNVAVCRDEILELLDKAKCEVLAFDLTGVKILPSGLLGLLASIREHGARVELYNPSSDVREALAVTKLDTLMTVHDLDVPLPSGDDEADGKSSDTDA